MMYGKGFSSKQYWEEVPLFSLFVVSKQTAKGSFVNMTYILLGTVDVGDDVSVCMAEITRYGSVATVKDLISLIQKGKVDVCSMLGEKWLRTCTIVYPTDGQGLAEDYKKIRQGNYDQDKRRNQIVTEKFWDGVFQQAELDKGFVTIIKPKDFLKDDESYDFVKEAYNIMGAHQPVDKHVSELLARSLEAFIKGLYLDEDEED